MTSSARPAGPVDPPPSARDVEVLLVDDNETWLSSTAQVLEHQRESFVVRTATGLSAAAAAVRETEPDCVVSDYKLERGTGLDLLAETRAEFPDLPFVLITGQGDETLASEALGEEATDYIPKRSLGGRDDLLARRIESAVERHRTRRALARERRSKESMLDILTATSSRDGIVREFCDHLVRDRGYDCAWIGVTDRSRGVVPRAVAGEEGYVDAVIDPGTPPNEGSEPALVALARDALHVVSPVAPDASDPPGERWREAAAGRGFASAAAVPIEHEGTALGVLAVYSGAEDVPPRERELLGGYAETIGYAMRSADWKESLLSADELTVDIEFGDAAVPLVAFDRRLPHGSSIEVLTRVPHEGRLLYVARITGATPPELREAADAVEAVERLRVDRREEAVRGELVVSFPSPEPLLAEHGWRVVATTVGGGRASITAAGSREALEPAIDAVEAVYPDAGVRSIRSGGGDRRPAAVDPLGSLTDKQRRAIELAFYAGYFERPRENNTTEVAEKFGVSRPTFTQHLRAAQRKLLARLLGA